MKKICYVANLASPHVKQWLELLDSDVELSIATIDAQVDIDFLSGFKFKVGDVLFLPRFLCFLPKNLRYMMLGWVLRKKRGAFCLLHAHNTSGYGLAALLSGVEYIVTTYGSEIYSSPQKSWLYRFLIRMVLSKARAVTASTPYMKKFLASSYQESVGKTFAFSLGVRDDFILTPFLTCTVKEVERPIWFSSRRVLPLYRTLEILRAFKSFKDKGGKGTLMILQGDAKGQYVDLVRDEAHNYSDVQFIEGFVDAKTVISLLDASDFIISVPESDQLSSSILEGMARKCIPILSNLDAYLPVSDNAIFVPEQSDFQSSLEDVLDSTARMDITQREHKSLRCREQVQSRFSKEKAKMTYAAIISSVFSW